MAKPKPYYVVVRCDASGKPIEGLWSNAVIVRSWDQALLTKQAREAHTTDIWIIVSGHKE